MFFSRGCKESKESVPLLCVQSGMICLLRFHSESVHTLYSHFTLQGNNRGEENSIFFCSYDKRFFSSRYAALQLDEAVFFLNFRSIFSPVIALKHVILMAKGNRGVIIVMLII